MEIATPWNIFCVANSPWSNLAFIVLIFALFERENSEIEEFSIPYSRFYSPFLHGNQERNNKPYVNAKICTFRETQNSPRVSLFRVEFIVGDVKTENTFGSVQ